MAGSVKDFIRKPKEKKMLQVRVDVEILEEVQKEADRQKVTLTDLQEALYLFWLSEQGKPFRRKQS